MNILIHSNYEPANYGGVEFVVSRLVDACVDAGHSVTCFFGGPKNSVTNDPTTGATHIERKILFKIRGACFLSLGNLKFFRSAIWADVVIFQEPYPSLWPALLGLKIFRRKHLVVLVHADPSASATVARLYSFLRAIVFRGFHQVTTSPALLSACPISGARSNTVIPIGLPDSQDQQEAVAPDPEGRYVLYFGRLAEYKGIDVLLEAIKSLPSVRFILAGTGPLSQTVLRFISEHELSNIRFVNRSISESEKMALIKGCEFLVFPSTNRNEAFGIVQIEAMRESKAVVNTDLGNGVNFVAPDQLCAVTCRPRDPESLSRAIELLWNDAGYREQLGDAGRDRFLGLFHIQRFNALWHQLLDSFSQP